MNLAVMPAKAGIQGPHTQVSALDPRLRWGDGRGSGKVAAFLAAALLLLPTAAEARQLTAQEKNQVMAAVRQRLQDPAAKFRWLPVANDTVYCGLINTAKTTGYYPFQVFGASGKSAKLSVVFATDRTTKDSIRQSCERYGYNFSQATE